jgi:very-short-patch-repair endonuclease
MPKRLTWEKIVESQKKFDKCVLKKQLLFDFYLNDLNMCIEYDGLQHYQPINYFGGLDNFEKQKKQG